MGTYENIPIKIPYKYVVEMLCDWVGAGIVYSNHRVDFNKSYSEPIEYYNRYRKERIFHPETQQLIEFFLRVIQDKGVNAFCLATKLWRKTGSY